MNTIEPSIEEQLQRVLDQIRMLQHEVQSIQLKLKHNNNKTYPWNRNKEIQYENCK